MFSVVSPLDTGRQLSVLTAFIGQSGPSSEHFTYIWFTSCVHRAKDSLKAMKVFKNTWTVSESLVVLCFARLRLRVNKKVVKNNSRKTTWHGNVNFRILSNLNLFLTSCHSLFTFWNAEEKHWFVDILYISVVVLGNITFKGVFRAQFKIHPRP